MRGSLRFEDHANETPRKPRVEELAGVSILVHEGDHELVLHSTERQVGDDSGTR